MTKAKGELLPCAVDDFQAGVDEWMDECFGAAIKADVQERCDRFIEEALEFVQAAGYSADRAHALVDYTFGRPTGEINQEVGGVMVTLAAMCNTLKVRIGAAANTELARVWTKVEQIRAKQAAKPTGSALPVATRATPPPLSEVEEYLDTAIGSFAIDPATTDYQRGFLAGLVQVRDEALATLHQQDGGDRG